MCKACAARPNNIKLAMNKPSALKLEDTHYSLPSPDCFDGNSDSELSVGDEAYLQIFEEILKKSDSRDRITKSGQRIVGTRNRRFTGYPRETPDSLPSPDCCDDDSDSELSIGDEADFQIFEEILRKSDSRDRITKSGQRIVGTRNRRFTGKPRETPERRSCDAFLRAKLSPRIEIETDSYGEDKSDAVFDNIESILSKIDSMKFMEHNCKRVVRTKNTIGLNHHRDELMDRFLCHNKQSRVIHENNEAAFQKIDSKTQIVAQTA